MSSRPPARVWGAAPSVPIGCERCGDESCETGVKRPRYGGVASALKTLRDSEFASALDRTDFEIEAVHDSLGSWSVIAYLHNNFETPAKPLVLKAMKCNYRTGEMPFETRFATEVAFQQRAADHGLAPAIHQYGWGSSEFFDDAGIRSSLRPFGESDTNMLYILMDRWPSTLARWWGTASEDDKILVRTLTDELYAKIAALGLRMTDITADNVLVRLEPLAVGAIDFDPTMTFEDARGAEAMRQSVEDVFDALACEPVVERQDLEGRHVSV